MSKGNYNNLVNYPPSVERQLSYERVVDIEKTHDGFKAHSGHYGGEVRVLRQGVFVKNLPYVIEYSGCMDCESDKQQFEFKGSLIGAFDKALDILKKNAKGVLYEFDVKFNETNLNSKVK